MSKPRPRHALWLEAIGASGLKPVERNVLRTLMEWANLTTGKCFPSVGSIVRQSGLGERTVQNALKSLERAQVLRMERSVGGRKRTHRMRIDLHALEARNPAMAAPFQEAQSPANGANGDTKPRNPCNQTVQTVRENGARAAPEHTKEHTNGTYHEPAGGWDLPADLRDDTNATPERVAWIRREVASGNVKSPNGFARKAIQEAWDPPPESDEDRKARFRRECEELIAAFRRLPKPERDSVCEKVYTDHPRRRGETPDTYPMQALIVQAMRERAHGPKAGTRPVPSPVGEAITDATGCRCIDTGTTTG